MWETDTLRNFRLITTSARRTIVRVVVNVCRVRRSEYDCPILGCCSSSGLLWRSSTSSSSARRQGRQLRTSTSNERIHSLCETTRRCAKIALSSNDKFTTNQYTCTWHSPLSHWRSYVRGIDFRVRAAPLLYIWALKQMSSFNSNFYVLLTQYLFRLFLLRFVYCEVCIHTCIVLCINRFLNFSSCFVICTKIKIWKRNKY